MKYKVTARGIAQEFLEGHLSRNEATRLIKEVEYTWVHVGEYFAWVTVKTILREKADDEVCKSRLLAETLKGRI